MNNIKREFVVNTPLGRIRIKAKHKVVDCPDDYPGVYIDLLDDSGGYEMLACVEYDSCHDRLQTCVYQPGVDEPCELVVHDID